MKIVFAGICCWVTRPSTPGKTVLIPNSTRGGAHRGVPIPPHSAFVHAKVGQVQSQNWQPVQVLGDNEIYLLEGDRITFDPIPTGGTTEISALPHVKVPLTNTPICPSADEIRPGFLDEPDAWNVLGIVELPPDAPVTTSSNANGAVFATLHMPEVPVTITANPFDGSAPRSLTIIDTAGSVYIANVTIADYLLGIPARDDDHQYLVCEIFRPRLRTRETPLPELSPAAVMTTELSSGPAHQVDHAGLAQAICAPARSMEDFLCTFAAGCSDSQWP